jgi:hypothetical protein
VYTKYSRYHSKLLPDADAGHSRSDAESLRYVNERLTWREYAFCGNRIMGHSKWRYRYVQCPDERQFDLYSQYIWYICPCMDDQQWYMYTKYGRYHSKLLPDAHNCYCWSDAESMRHAYQYGVRRQHADEWHRCMECSQRGNRFFYSPDERELQFHCECIWDVCPGMDDQQWYVYTKYSRYHSKLLPDADAGHSRSDAESLRYVNERLTWREYAFCGNRIMGHSKWRYRYV